MYIAVAGNIGAGKTTLTNMLSKYYGWVPKFESVDNNPYLDDFYNDMERWAYHLQIYFFNQRGELPPPKVGGFLIQRYYML